MAIYWPTPGLKGGTFKLCVLTRWDFNFCVRSSPLRVVQSGAMQVTFFIKKKKNLGATHSKVKEKGHKHQTKKKTKDADLPYTNMHSEINIIPEFIQIKFQKCRLNNRTLWTFTYIHWCRTVACWTFARLLSMNIDICPPQSLSMNFSSVCVHVRVCVCVCVCLAGKQTFAIHASISIHDKQGELDIHEYTCVCARARARVCVCLC